MNFLFKVTRRNTVVEKESAFIGFKDKSNDISKKFYVAKKDQSYEKPTEHKVNQENYPKHEVLIPLTKEEAKHQVQLKKQFYQQTKQIKNLEKHFQKPGKQREKVMDKRKEKNSERTSEKINQKINKEGKSEWKQKDGEKQRFYQQKQSLNQSEKSNVRKYKQKTFQTVKKYKQKNEFQKLYREKNPSKKAMKSYEQKNIEKSNEVYSVAKTKQKSFSKIYVEKPNLPVNEVEKEKVSEDQKKQDFVEDIKLEDLKVEDTKTTQDIKQDGFEESNDDKNENSNDCIMKEENQPAFLQYKHSEPQPYIELKDVVSREGEHVNISAFITKKQRNMQQFEHDCLIADKSGSLWARFSHELQIEGANWYEIDNLLVFQDNNQIMLKSTDFSEAKISFENGKSFSFKPIKK